MLKAAPFLVTDSKSNPHQSEYSAGGSEICGWWHWQWWHWWQCWGQWLSPWDYLLSWPQWRARCVIVAVLGPSSRTIQFVVTDISIIHSGSILICLQYPYYHSSASGSIKMIRALKSFSVLRWDNPHKICSGQIFALERPRTICNLMVKAKAVF